MDDDTLLTAQRQLQSIPGLNTSRRDECIAGLRHLSARSQESVEAWVGSGVVPSFAYKGLTVERLVEVMKVHPLVGIIMLDRLMKDSSAYRPVIREREGRLTFTLRDAPRGSRPSRPLAAPLTRAAAESVGQYFYSESIDPPELHRDGPWPVRLSTTVTGVTRAVTIEDFEIELDKLRQVIELAGDAPTTADPPWSEIQRIGLVLRLIEALATDDLRALRAVADQS
jgi:hypothetical protein